MAPVVRPCRRRAAPRGVLGAAFPVRRRLGIAGATLKLLRSLLPAGKPAGREPASAVEPSPPPAEVTADGAAAFPIGAHLASAGGLPVVDWAAATAWLLESVPDASSRGRVWSRLERAWMDHMGAALGPGYVVRESDTALLLSTLAPNVAGAALGFMGKTLQRIVRVLDGVAQPPEWGKDILIIFDDEDSYYRYVSHYYPRASSRRAAACISMRAAATSPPSRRKTCAPSSR